MRPVEGEEVAGQTSSRTGKTRTITRTCTPGRFRQRSETVFVFWFIRRMTHKAVIRKIFAPKYLGLTNTASKATNRRSRVDAYWKTDKAGGETNLWQCLAAGSPWHNTSDHARCFSSPSGLSHSPPRLNQPSTFLSYLRKHGLQLLSLLVSDLLVKRIGRLRLGQRGCPFVCRDH